MVRQSTDLRKLAAGAIFCILAGCAGYKSFDYRLGTATQMGPGYFPLCLSIVLFLLGLGAMATSLRSIPAMPAERWRIVPLILVLLGIVTFGLTVERVGLGPAIAALVLLACLERLRTAPFEVIAICVLLIALCLGLFVYALGMPFIAYRF